MPIDLLLRFLAEPADLTMLSEPGCWSAVKKSANRLGVATLAAHAARAGLQPEDRLWCDRILASSWSRHEKSLHNLGAVLALLEAEEIVPMALKGPMLACRYYDPPFLRRPSGDLDLAVRREDLDRASAAMVRAGYKLRMPVAAAKLRSHHVELSHPDRQSVELHFNLSHGAFGIPVDEFFDRAIPCEMPGGRTVLVPDPADEIMQLALHFVHSSDITLFHLCEIRRIWMAATPGVRQDAVNRAAMHHFAGVFTVLDIAIGARWGETLLPPEIRREKTWLHARLNGAFYAAFERRFLDGRAPLSMATRLSRKWLLLQMTDRPIDALRLAFISARTALLQFPG